MQVKNWMIRKVVTISKNGLITDALTLMKKYAIRHLPVVEDKILIGLITESDLRHVMIPSLMNEMRLDQVMIKNPVTIGPNESLEEAARLIYRYKIGGFRWSTKGNW